MYNVLIDVTDEEDFIYLPNLISIEYRERYGEKEIVFRKSNVSEQIFSFENVNEIYFKGK